MQVVDLKAVMPRTINDLHQSREKGEQRKVYANLTSPFSSGG